MTPAPPRRAPRSGDAEDLAIRFVNTVAWRLRDPTEERMATPEAMLAWLRRNGLADAGTLDAVVAAWRLHPAAAHDAHRTAVRLREAIYALFVGRIHGE